MLYIIWLNVGGALHFITVAKSKSKSPKIVEEIWIFTKTAYVQSIKFTQVLNIYTNIIGEIGDMLRPIIVRPS